MKLRRGDYVKQKDLTAEQYHKIAKKFMVAGAELGEYRSNSWELRTHEYFGWHRNSKLFHGHESFTNNKEGRLLTAAQILDEDNSWYERGELPPVGTECEYQGGPSIWNKVTIVAHVSEPGTLVAIIQGENCWAYSSTPSKFRPIKSERNKVIEAAFSRLDKKELATLEWLGHAQRIITTLVDAGFTFPTEHES